jgi:hypothetical protein
MDFHLTVPWQWPGPWTRVIIIVVIFLFVARLAPDAVVPLGLGGWLGGWLTVKPARALPAGGASCP